MIISFLKKIAVYIEKKQNKMFKYDVKKQKKYLAKYKEPSDDIQKSFYQYKCQMKLYGIFLTFILNILAFPICIYFFLKSRNICDTNFSNEKKAVFFRDGKPINILPNSLKKEFNEIEYNPKEEMLLKFEDKKYLFNIIKRYPFHYLFILKNLIKIAKYRYAIEMYKCSAIICCCEYSFTSSILTDFCNKNNVELINVMHGEKLFFIRDSFFRFNRFYVWNDYYLNIFKLLRTNCDKYIVEVPDSLLFKNNYLEKRDIDYTYYLAAENSKELNIINKTLLQLKNKGNYKIFVRPHPRYSDINEIKKIFTNFSIEDINNVSIEESILRTKNAIALYSTVLNQAYTNGTNIIIDDISAKYKYKKLRELMYIFSQNDIERLSLIVKGEK